MVPWHVDFPGSALGRRPLQDQGLGHHAGESVSAALDKD